MDGAQQPQQTYYRLPSGLFFDLREVLMVSSSKSESHAGVLCIHFKDVPYGTYEMFQTKAMAENESDMIWNAITALS